MKIEVEIENFNGYIDVDENNFTVIKTTEYISDGTRGRKKQEDKPTEGTKKIREDVLGHCSSLERAVSVITRSIMANKNETVTLKGYVDSFNEMNEKLIKILDPTYERKS